MLTSEDCDKIQTLDGTKSPLANAAARLAYSLRTLGVVRTVKEVADRIAYNRRARHLKQPENRRPEMEGLSRCSWVQDLGVDVREESITCEELSWFLDRTRYPYYYYGKSRRVRYAMWHMVGLQLCALTADDVALDSGAGPGIWGRIVRKEFGCGVFDVDRRYRSGIHGTRIGCDADTVPLPDRSLTRVVSFCSFNCFDNTGDIGMLREASRLLTDGGRLVIIPLCIADAHVNLYDPLIREHAEGFDRGAAGVAWHGWGNNFGRWYDKSAFKTRILENIPGFRLTLWHIRHPEVQSAETNEFYAAEFVKDDCLAGVEPATSP